MPSAAFVWVVSAASVWRLLFGGMGQSGYFGGRYSRSHVPEIKTDDRRLARLLVWWLRLIRQRSGYDDDA